MNRRLLTFAGALALAAVLGKFYAVPAIAQAARAALVQDRDNPARQPFSAVIPAVGGIASSPAVPAGMRLIVTNMYFDLQASSGLACGAEVIAPEHHSFHSLVAQAAFPSAGGTTYAADHAFQIIADAGQFVQVNLGCPNPDPGSGGAPFKVNSPEVVFTGYMIGIP
jgi:hypothetical protein